MRFLLLNQTFHPDCVATAQVLRSLAVELVRKGHQVTVVTGRRAYDDPLKLFPAYEEWEGIKIHRIGSTGLGKSAKWKRALDFASFLLVCCCKLVTLPRHDVVVALTSPPLISVLGAVYSKLRRARFFYWIMDLNPDEAIAAGWLRPQSLPAKMLELLSRFSMRGSEKVVALDRFMEERVAAKGISRDKIFTLPPWSDDSHIVFDEDGRERFRKRHGLTEKFVVMYSGNHSPCHPLDTLLEAARRLGAGSKGQGDGSRKTVEAGGVAFVFVGGGSEFTKVKRFASEHRLTNILCLPYQPISELSASLSAADLHVVVMGDPFVGIIHPCKIYNILRTSRPVLYIGPATSHVTDLFHQGTGRKGAADQGVNDGGQQKGLYVVGHGDFDGIVNRIQSAAAVATAQASREQTGEVESYFAALAEPFSSRQLLPKLVQVLEGHTD